MVYKEGVKNTEVNHDLHSVINKTDHKKVLTAIRNSPEIQPEEINRFNEWFLDDPGFVKSIIQREGDGGITPDMLINANAWHGNDYWKAEEGTFTKPQQTPDEIALNREKTSDLQYCSLTGIFNGNFQAKQFFEDDNSLYESAQNPRKLTIRRFDQVSKKDGTKGFNHKNCLMLFNGLYGNYPNNIGDLNVFFVVDVGDRCIKSMSTGDPKIGFPINDSKGVSLNTFLPFNTYNTYHIHTTTTYSDSADKMSAEKPWYDKTYKNQHKNKQGQREPKLPLVRSCLLTKNITVGDVGSHINRKLFMSDYNATVGWRVPTMHNKSPTFQKWEHSNPSVTDPNYGTYETHNPKIDNNKPTVLKWLKESKNGAMGSDGSYGRLLKNAGKPDYPIGANKKDDENRVSLEVQKKRSGDAWQILTALNMYKMVEKDVDLKLVRPKELASAGTKLFSNLTTDDAKKKYFKKNTIFITSDWPALAFALSLGVNCIMCYFYPSDEEKKCFFSFIFDDEGMGAVALPMEQEDAKKRVLDILLKTDDVRNISEEDKQYVYEWMCNKYPDKNKSFSRSRLVKEVEGEENASKLVDILGEKLKPQGKTERTKDNYILLAKKKKTKRKKKKSKKKTKRKKEKTKKKKSKKSKKKKRSFREIIIKFLK